MIATFSSRNHYTCDDLLAEAMKMDEREAEHGKGKRKKAQQAQKCLAKHIHRLPPIIDITIEEFQFSILVEGLSVGCFWMDMLAAIVSTETRMKFVVVEVGVDILAALSIPQNVRTLNWNPRTAVRCNIPWYPNAQSPYSPPEPNLLKASGFKTCKP